jgi:hypothetical protein
MTNLQKPRGIKFYHCQKHNKKDTDTKIPMKYLFSPQKTQKNQSISIFFGPKSPHFQSKIALFQPRIGLKTRKMDSNSALRDPSRSPMGTSPRAMDDDDEVRRF